MKFVLIPQHVLEVLVDGVEEWTLEGECVNGDDLRTYITFARQLLEGQKDV